MGKYLYSFCLLSFLRRYTTNKDKIIRPRRNICLLIFLFIDFYPHIIILCFVKRPINNFWSVNIIFGMNYTATQNTAHFFCASVEESTETKNENLCIFTYMHFLQLYRWKNNMLYSEYVVCAFIFVCACGTVSNRFKSPFFTNLSHFYDISNNFFWLNGDFH